MCLNDTLLSFRKIGSRARSNRHLKQKSKYGQTLLQVNSMQRNLQDLPVPDTDPQSDIFTKTYHPAFDTIPSMKPLGLVLARIVTVLFALTMLVGYVCFRQEIGPFATEDSVPEFPQTPVTPTMFSTSKSGPVFVDPVELPPDSHAMFSGTKVGVLITQEGRKEVPLTVESIDALIDKAVATAPETKDANKILLIPGTKNIAMPIFDTKQTSSFFDIEPGEDPLEPEAKDADDPPNAKNNLPLPLLLYPPEPAESSSPDSK